MLHGLTTFLGLIMWAFILVVIVPKVYRFAMANRKAIAEGVRMCKLALAK
jgi:hypothetical protein